MIEGILAVSPKSEEDLPRLFETAEPFPPLEALFDQVRPLEIEIGCGKGNFLVQLARQRPDGNYLGIDRVVKWMRTGIRKGEKLGLRNIKFVKAEACEFLKRFIPPDSVHVFHVNFPDPWPKRRHRKRRLVNASFLRMLHERLCPGGCVELTTDFEDYFQEMRRAAETTAGLWNRIRESTNERLLGEGLQSSYERKFETRGINRYYLELVK